MHCLDLSFIKSNKNSKAMQTNAADNPPPNKTKITRMFPDMLGFVGITFSLPKTRSDLLINFGHQSSRPVVWIKDSCRRIEDGTYDSEYANVISDIVYAPLLTSECFPDFFNDLCRSCAK